jgi:hypothetical protein
MSKDYSVAETTKVQREKYVSDAIYISVLDAPMPSLKAMELMREYVGGKIEIADAKKHLNKFRDVAFSILDYL